MAKLSGNLWTARKCGRCGLVHEKYSGKIDSKGVEYVICGNTGNKIKVPSHHFRLSHYYEKKIPSIGYV